MDRFHDIVTYELRDAVAGVDLAEATGSARASSRSSKSWCSGVSEDRATCVSSRQAPAISPWFARSWPSPSGLAGQPFVVTAQRESPDACTTDGVLGDLRPADGGQHAAPGAFVVLCFFDGGLLMPSEW